MSLLIREERSADAAAVRQVNIAAFAQPAEARLVARLQKAGVARLSLVAEAEGEIVGHILFSDLPIAAGEKTIPAVALAPMAVLPAYQRQGIGSELVRRGLQACRERNIDAVIVVGHPEFYLRFGFSAELAEPIEAPFSGPAFMAIELRPGALAGIRGRVTYPPEFFEM